MEIVKSGKTKKVSERWKLQYNRKNGWSTTCGKNGFESAKLKYEQILAIENSRVRNKLDKIDEVIGNKSWTHAYCSVCGIQTRDNLVSIDVSGGNYSCNLCITCVKKMLTLLENAK
jgi:hypothetical protein